METRLTTLPGIEYKQEVIHIDQIDFGLRYRKDMRNLMPLAMDISTRGVMSSILVVEKDLVDLSEYPTELDPEKPYLLLAGERRCRAVQLAFESNILDPPVLPTRVFERLLDEEEIRLMELHENLLREQLSPAEDLELKARLVELQDVKFGVAPGKKVDGRRAGTKSSIQATADLLGQDRSTLSKDLSMYKELQANPSLLKQAKDKELSKADMRRLLDEKKRQLAMEEINRRAEARRKTETKDQLDHLREGTCKRFILGDTYKLLKKVPDRSVDLIELDPDWGISFKKKELDKAKRAGNIAQAQQIEDYQTIPPSLYAQTLEDLLQECHRTMKDHSWLLLWYSIQDWHQTTADILARVGFTFSPMPGFWVKKNGNSATPAYRLGDTVTAFFYARKGNVRLQTLGRNNSFLFRGLRNDERAHAAEKPIELYMELLRTFATPGMTTLTPFAGSGNFIHAATNLGIQAIGYDIGKANKDRFDMRVNTEVPGKIFSYKTAP